MSVTILEALENANANLDNIEAVGLVVVLPIIKAQLKNSITLLEKGYSIYDEVEPLLDKYGEVENVPKKETN